ncbi:hypothetical protein ACA910_012704 [Epithemia clementina (nom. ined.)]
MFPVQRYDPAKVKRQAKEDQTTAIERPPPPEQRAKHKKKSKTKSRATSSTSPRPSPPFVSNNHQAGKQEQEEQEDVTERSQELQQHRPSPHKKARVAKVLTMENDSHATITSTITQSQQTKSAQSLEGPSSNNEKDNQREQAVGDNLKNGYEEDDFMIPTLETVQNLIQEEDDEEEDNDDDDVVVDKENDKDHNDAVVGAEAKRYGGGGVLEPSAKEIQSALRACQLPLRHVAAEIWKLAPFLIHNLERHGYTSFFPIQALSIPDVLTSERYAAHQVQAQDLCITAPTGSGKTLSYVLPILQALSTRLVPRLCALVILPTRDLALQVHQVFQEYVQGSNLQVGLAVGQSDFEAEQIALTRAGGVRTGGEFTDSSVSFHRLQTIDPTNLDLALDAFGHIQAPGSYSELMEAGVDILVCTPGRLIDHLDCTPGFSLHHLRYLVVDEADRLLSERYQNWIDRVLNEVSNNKITKHDHARTSFSDSLTVNPISPGRTKTEDALLMDCYEPRTWRREDFLSSMSSSSLPPSSTTVNVRRPVQLRKFLVTATMTRDPQKLESLRLVNPKIFNVHRLFSLSNGSKANDGGGDDNKFLLPSSLQEYSVDCTSEQKPLVLCVAILQHLREQPNGLVIVFAASVESSHRLARLLQLLLRQRGGDQSNDVGGFHPTLPDGTVFGVVEFSSALLQENRTNLVQLCRQQQREQRQGIAVVVCSDGMSRGIDLNSITLVINYDVPKFAKTYVHRCGRTARAGKPGTSICILKKEQIKKYKRMRQLILAPERVQHWMIDKSLARTIVPIYRQSLFSLREVLEAEGNGDLKPTASIPSYLVGSKEEEEEDADAMSED